MAYYCMQVLGGEAGEFGVKKLSSASGYKKNYTYINFPLPISLKYCRACAESPWYTMLPSDSSVSLSKSLKME